MSVRRFEHAPRVLAAAAFACLPVAVCLAALAAWPSAAQADRPRDTLASAPPADVALWRDECGACHVAYPARLLAAGDWRRVMSGLDQHFGTDASVDAASRGRIEALLLAGAGRGRPAPDGRDAPRITTTPWFTREHDEVPARLWKDPRVGSPARCESCHVDAATGRFDEERIRWPTRR